MFDIVRNNRRFMQVFLGLIILPFAFWGVESYVSNFTSESDVVEVGGAKISQVEYQQSLREQQEKVRSALGGQVSQAMLDSPEMRRAVLDSLIDRRLLSVFVQKTRMSINDSQLADYIRNVPELQEGGKFSRQRYEQLVAQQGLSQEMFEARVRQDLSLQQAIIPVAGGVLGQASANRWLAAQLEEREIAEIQLKPEQFAASVKLPADAAKSYYDSHGKNFETPEQVKAEYIVLSMAKVADQAGVSEEDIRKEYEARADRYTRSEERRASHMLILAGKEASDDERKAAQKKAEELLAQVRRKPMDFAQLAEKNSQDPGSAKKGGDLDWFPRDGRMVKPFEDAVFSLKEGEISDLVRTDYGFHIIRITGVRPAAVRPLSEVRQEIADALKTQAGAKKFASLAEAVGNAVYEQSDSLKPVAEKYQLTIQQSDWLAREGKAAPPFANPKLLAALFSDDAIKNKRNTEAIEVAPNTLVAARVLEHRTAAQQPFEAVRDSIEKQLVREAADKAAMARGTEAIASLGRGENVGDLRWGEARKVRRIQARSLFPEGTQAIFAASTGKLPAYAGVVLAQGGFAIYRISAVRPFAPGKDNIQEARGLRQQYGRLAADQELKAWLDTLRKRYELRINKAVMEQKDK